MAPTDLVKVDRAYYAATSAPRLQYLDVVTLSPWTAREHPAELELMLRMPPFVVNWAITRSTSLVLGSLRRRRCGPSSGTRRAEHSCIRSFED